MHYHPAGLIIVSLIFLILFFRQTRVFTFIAIIYPILVALLLTHNGGKEYLSFFNIEFIIDFSSQNRLIAFAFTMVTLAANLNACGRRRKWEVIIGGSYCVSSMICLFAGDFISMFTALEAMIIASCLLITIGEFKQSIRAARQYFLTHLISSSMILVGITYIIAKTGNTEIISITKLINNRDQAFLIYSIMFTGCLINVASFPFSGWLINCYPFSSSSGLIYLISFTTKVSIMILIKLFGNFEVLKLFGLLMILYGGIYSCIEENIKRIFCYLTISQLGFILIAIGANSEQAIFGVIVFVFIHILYKALFGLYIAALSEGNIINCFDLKKANLSKQPLLLISWVLSILMMINFPPLASFTTKIAITSSLAPDICYFAVTFLNLVTSISLGSMVQEQKYFTHNFAPKLNLLSKISLICMIALTLIMGLFIPKFLILVWHSYPIDILAVQKADLIKHFAVIIIGMIMGLRLKIKRIATTSINFDLFHIIGNSFFHIYNWYLKSHTKSKDYENYGLAKIKDDIIGKVSKVHNQQTAVFMVFFLLIILILVLMRPKF